MCLKPYTVAIYEKKIFLMQKRIAARLLPFTHEKQEINYNTFFMPPFFHFLNRYAIIKISTSFSKISPLNVTS
jgi:hypothetical protein